MLKIKLLCFDCQHVQFCEWVFELGGFSFSLFVLESLSYFICVCCYTALHPNPLKSLLSQIVSYRSLHRGRIVKAVFFFFLSHSLSLLLLARCNTRAYTLVLGFMCNIKSMITQACSMKSWRNSWHLVNLSKKKRLARWQEAICIRVCVKMTNSCCMRTLADYNSKWVINHLRALWSILTLFNCLFSLLQTVFLPWPKRSRIQ